MEINGWGGVVISILHTQFYWSRQRSQKLGYIYYEFSNERWLACSDFRVTLCDVDINTNKHHHHQRKHQHARVNHWTKP